MPVLANGGTGSAATTASASTRPRAVVACERRAARAVRPRRGCVAARRRARSRAARARCTSSRRYVANAGPRSSRSSASSTFALQEVELLADVVAAARADRSRTRVCSFEQQRDRVGELELAARAGLDAVERVEDLGREHVAADHREVRRRLVALRLLDDAAELDEPVDRLADRVRRSRTTRSPRARTSCSATTDVAVRSYAVEHRAEQRARRRP